MVRRRVLAPARPAELTLDVSGWFRRGGRRCSVHVTADEFAEAVRVGLVEEFGPWLLTGSDSMAGPDGERVETPWAADEVAFGRYGTEPSGRPRINMWGWSPALTRSHPPLSVGREYESICGLNGFLSLQWAMTPMYLPVPRRATTRDVCIVDAVYTDTGDLPAISERLAPHRTAVAEGCRPSRSTARTPASDGYPWSAAGFAEAVVASA